MIVLGGWGEEWGRLPGRDPAPGAPRWAQVEQELRGLVQNEKGAA